MPFDALCRKKIFKDVPNYEDIKEDPYMKWDRMRSATQHYVTIPWEENLKKDRYIYMQT